MSEPTQNKIRMALNAEVRIIDDKTGLVDYVASDETCDWYDEVVKVNGWQFTWFQKNAPFVDSHNYWSIDSLLGRVVNYELTGGQLIERVQWATDVTESPLATIGWKMTLGGYLKAVSVGFVPLEQIWRGQTGFEDALKEVKADPTRVRRIFTKQEQLELSACVLGANPNALAKSWEDGAISDQDLARAGFGSDAEMDFLLKAGSAWENDACDQAFRSIITLEMQRVFAARNHSQGTSPKGSGATPTPRDAGEDAERRAAERSEFLKQLGGMTR